MIRQNYLVYLLVAVWLVGCSTPQPAPTALPTLPATMLPEATLPEMETTISAPATQSSSMPEPTPTLIPTPWLQAQEPIYNPNTLPGASIPYLSSLGQLAFIEDGLLYVETTPGSGEFQEIGRYSTSARWSPDGTKLLYDASQSAPDLGQETSVVFDEYRIWFAERGASESLNKLIPGFPQPPYIGDGWIPTYTSGPTPFRNDWTPYDWQNALSGWSPDSTKILFVNLVEPDRLLTTFPGANTISIADMENGEFRLGAEANLISAVYPVDGRSFVLQDHCGPDCEWLSGYNLLGELTWQLPWVTGGYFAISSDRTFLVNAGRIAFFDPTDTNTVDEINPLTGEFKEIWRLRPNQSFPFASVVYPTRLSPDSRYVSFYVLEDEQVHMQIIDREGNEHLQIPNALLYHWDPPDGLIALQPGSDGTPGSVQLELWGFSGGGHATILGPVSETFNEAEWSPDFHYLAICSYDSANQQQNVRLWDRQSNQILEVQSALASEANLCSFAWMPNSSLLYYRLGRVEPTEIRSRLYAYDTRSAGLQEVTASPSQP